MLDARDQFTNDTGRIRDQYGRIITDNMTDQRDTYLEIIGQIKEHSKDLDRAKQIEKDLEKLLDDVKRSAENQIHDRLQQ